MTYKDKHRVYAVPTELLCKEVIDSAGSSNLGELRRVSKGVGQPKRLAVRSKVLQEELLSMAFESVYQYCRFSEGVMSDKVYGMLTHIEIGESMTPLKEGWYPSQPSTKIRNQTDPSQLTNKLRVYK